MKIYQLKEIHLSGATMSPAEVEMIMEAFPNLELFSILRISKPVTAQDFEKLKKSISGVKVLYLPYLWVGSEDESDAWSDGDLAEFLSANPGLRGLEILLPSKSGCEAVAAVIADMYGLEYLGIRSYSGQTGPSSQVRPELPPVFRPGHRSLSMLVRLKIIGYCLDRESIQNIAENAPNLRCIN